MVCHDFDTTFDTKLHDSPLASEKRAMAKIFKSNQQ